METSASTWSSMKWVRPLSTKGCHFADLDVVQTRLAPGMPAFHSNPSWLRAVEHMGKKACVSSSLQKLLFLFVACIGSTSGVEQTQRLAQFRHLRSFSMLGVQRVLVLASSRGQAHEEDLALYSRARQIW